MADVKASFTGSMPEYYDSCLGPAWFDAFAQDLAQRLPAKPPGDVLEIACGTGLVTRRQRARLDPSVRLTATDLSQAMLEYARGFRETRLEKIRIQVDRVSARTVATGQIRGTPRSLLIEKRGVALEEVVEKVAAALAKMGGADPLRAPANAIMVEATAI